MHKSQDLNNTSNAFCEECSDYVDFDIKIEEETINVKNKLITTQILKAYCKKCGCQIYVRDIEKINDKIIYSKINNP